jgi:hypothetical protein
MIIGILISIRTFYDMFRRIACVGDLFWSTRVAKAVSDWDMALFLGR